MFVRLRSAAAVGSSLLIDHHGSGHRRCSTPRLLLDVGTSQSFIQFDDFRQTHGSEPGTVIVHRLFLEGGEILGK